VLLKMGTYGFLRFNMPLFPQAAYFFVPLFSILAIIGIVYGALVCIVQKDLKRLIAFSSVSHLGFVMLGLFTFNVQGIQGGVIQMINHGLSTGALFLIVGMIYERRHTRMIADFGGLSTPMPVYAAIFMIVTLSSIGLPGLNGFVGEFLILLGTFKVNKAYAVIAATQGSLHPGNPHFCADVAVHRLDRCISHYLSEEDGSNHRELRGQDGAGKSHQGHSIPSV